MREPMLKSVATFFRLDDAGWERHSNPWSVYTRIAIWPVLIITLWSFHWIGVYALIPLSLIALWAFVNPRAFPPPASTKSWASRAVLGERVYLAHEQIPIPDHHRIAARTLAISGGLGSLVMIAGLLLASPALFLAGAVAAFFAKMWFIDRMVWLFDDMSARHTPYAAWLK